MNLSGNACAIKEVPMKKIIVSYTRVSTTKQSTDGLGIDIQRNANNKSIAELIKQDNSLTLIEEITESESAFKGANMNTIKDIVESGKYAKDSVIVVYDQTRFSRTTPLKALSNMEEIISSGFKIHLSAKNKTIEKLETLEELIVPLVESAAANQESVNRSNRTTGSYQTRIQAGLNVYIGHTPNWISKSYDQGKITGYVIKEDRQTIIENIFNMYVKGDGANAITKWLNANVEPWGEFDYRRKNLTGRVWGESYVSKILRNPSVIGHRTFNRSNDKDEVTVSDYYPPVISKELYYKAADIRINRVGSQVHRTKHPSIFYIGLAYCGYCGGKIVPQNFNNNTRASIRCSAMAKGQTTECAGGSSPAKFLEKVLIELCRDEVNYNLLFQEKVDTSGLVVKKATLSEEYTSLEYKLDNLATMLATGKIDSVVYDKLLGKDNERIKQIRSEVAIVEGEIDKSTHINTNDEGEFLELLKQIKTDEIPQETRLLLKDLLRKFISRIDVYRYGSQWKTEKKWAEYKDLVNQDEELISFVLENHNPFAKERSRLSYLITFKNGNSRMVAFDYTTGDWSFTATTEGGILK
jgi:DNA invertase Pin-like site-specific DNA recombinase